MAFEGGVSSTVALAPIRAKFDPKLYAGVRERGIAAVVKEESRSIAELDLYQKFLQEGWTVGLAKAVKAVVVKRTPQLIAAAWLSAYAEAGYPVKA